MSKPEYQSIPEMMKSVLTASQPVEYHYHFQGKWNHYSAVEFLEQWQNLSWALHDLGLEVKQTVAIMAPSSPFWILCDLATQTCRGWTVPFFLNLSLENFEFQCRDAEVKIIFIDDPNNFNNDQKKLLQKVETVICFHNHQDLPKALSLNDLLHKGDELKKADDSNWFDNEISKLQRDDIATIVYASGSTGFPKGSEISHGNLLFQFESAQTIFQVDSEKDVVLSVLPVAHIFERMAVYYFSSQRLPIWFGSEPKLIGSYLKEVKPTSVTMVPRILERLYEALTSSAQSARGIKKFILMGAIRYARSGDPLNKSWRWYVWNALVYRKMREALGGRINLIVSGSSALNAVVHRFLLNIGLPVYEGYGLTESSPTLAAEYKDHINIGSVGPAFPGVKMRIGKDDEIEVLSPGNMRGYHNNPEATKEAFCDDGWLKTGDTGYIDENGYLFITGRLKELFKTSTGKYISPVPIENEVMRDPFIETAVVIADNKKFTSALIFLNHVQCAAFLRKTEANYDPKVATQSKRIKHRIDRRIKRVNSKLNEWEQIKKWVILPDTMTPESGLLTPTLKIRRHKIDIEYSDAIENIYGKDIDAEV
ncbi:MAG: long-chain fatty acid--CoA ligase [Fibrobacter sp.]|nr:long-chain fatty acid--CoA ligase [Fibrobacter sp.]